MALDFVGSPSKALLFIIITALSFLDLSCLLLQLAETSGELVALIEELPHLREQHNVG